MTEQEIFDKVATHLLTQNEKAVNSTGGCVYRTGKGLKCAVGCLISDDLYDPSLEGLGVIVFVRTAARPDRVADCRVARDIAKKIGLEEEHGGLLGDLQNIHDTRQPKTWRSFLLSVAKDHKLNAEVCDA